jgi:hypothetical protein
MAESEADEKTLSFIYFSVTIVQKLITVILWSIDNDRQTIQTLRINIQNYWMRN